ncbi:MAG: hypothetical protein ABR596_02610 [Halarsenatibacteraceae bacterium]
MKNLKRKIKREGFSYSELSQQMDIELNDFIKKVKGVTEFDVEEVYQLVDLLNIKPENINKYFFKGGNLLNDKIINTY